MADTKSIIRTKTYYCGKGEDKKPKYIEIDLFPYVESTRARKRNYKTNVTAPAQKNLNNNYAKKYLRLLLKSNFEDRDFHIVLTYSDSNMPEGREAADKEARNFIRRLGRLAKKNNLDDLRYVIVTEESKKGRIHHHLILKANGLKVEEIESCWQKKEKGKDGKSYFKPIGYVKLTRLVIDKKSLDALAGYLSKDPKGRKRWRASRNLVKPQVSTSDTKCSKRKYYTQLSLWPDDSQELHEYFERQYPEYDVAEVIKYFCEESSTMKITARLSRRI